jgi:hypothetical protein
MIELKRYNISDVSKKGISSIINIAEADGMCMITRKSQPAALILPLSMIGFQKYINMLNEIINSKSGEEGISELRSLLKIIDSKSLTNGNLITGE